VVAGRANGAEGVAGFAGEDGIDGVEHAARSAQCDVPGVRTDVGIAGAQVRAAGGDIAVGDGEVFAGVAEGELVGGGGPRLDEWEVERSEGFHDGVEALRTLRLAVAPREMLAADRVGGENGASPHFSHSFYCGAR
jgi:hypothetical protein